MSSSPAVGNRARIAWGVLTVLLALETLLLVWVTYLTGAATFGDRDFLVQNASLWVMSVCSLLWVLITLIGALRSRASWVRGSAVTIHVLLFAAGTGCLQLAIGSWQFGFALVGAALVGFVAAILAKPLLQSDAVPN
ncbi:hypothetical protein NHL51_07080 [Leucobacter sp. gxy201]|uniref:hypothetical protein n=1 Tax=Leucobacter sp. gxy201 TaxID=2957200 RepID=UPI003DA16B52